MNIRWRSEPALVAEAMESGESQRERMAWAMSAWDQ